MRTSFIQTPTPKSERVSINEAQEKSRQTNSFAIDPKTGKEVWRHKNFAPLWGGVLTTKGNLVFTGTPEGFLQAFNAKTGEKVWEFQTGSGVLGSPVTWEMDGEQYVSVLSGWGGAVPLWGGEVAKRIKDFNQGGMLWTFKLPKELVAKH